MAGSLFISYSHLDMGCMLAAKKHLQGMLHGRVEVWSDQNIAAGSSWQDNLLGNLNQAASALVLASPDYLVSTWCRRELSALFEARKAGKLSAIYWLLLRPCGWPWTELAHLQALQEPATRALLSLPEGPEREQLLLRCCETLAQDLLRHVKDEDPEVAAVREVLARSAYGAQITPLSTMTKGDFAIICRAVRSNGDDVVVKLLTNTPLHRMRELFHRVSIARKEIDDSAAIRMSDVFTDGEGYAQRIVILGDYARGDTLLKVMQDDQQRAPRDKALTLDAIGTLLYRLARLIGKLHRLPPIRWQGEGGSEYRHLMGPLVPQNIFYDKDTQRVQLSLVGVTNFLWHFFEPDTFRAMVSPSSGTYIAPEKRDSANSGAAIRGGHDSVTEKTDQYFLGMLALELLEGRQLYVAPEGRRPTHPRDVMHPVVWPGDPPQASPRWMQHHEQLAGIVERLLADDPDERFENMAQVVAALGALEDSQRALAKYAFRHLVAPCGDDGEDDLGFASDFYAAFLGSDTPAAAKFRAAWQRSHPADDADAPGPEHHRKLLEGLKSVLNFRAGGRPSAMASVARRHRGFGLLGEDFSVFEDCFIATLRQRMDRQASDDAPVRERIVAAWRSLFAAANAAMDQDLRERPAATDRCGSAGPDQPGITPRS